MIYVLYRHTSNPTGFGKNRPEWFSFDKCLDSMLKSIEEDSNVEFHMLCDMNPLDSVFPVSDYAINKIYKQVNFKGGSDWASYNFAWNYAKDLNIKEGDIIFLAENDYLFLPNWSYKVQELFNTYEDLDYVSLYDHPDFYKEPHNTVIFPTKTHHWKTIPSSTGSIIFGKRILEEDYDIFISNPSDRGRFEYLIPNRHRNVLCPIPSLSTHCEIEYLAPVINWKEI